MRIKEISLQTTSIEKVKDFYANILGLPLLEENGQKVSFSAGHSILTFISSQELDDPYYHFAFNITSGKKDAALLWLKEKNIAINKIDGQEEFYSKYWNSHSIYFYDPSGNIVEFIFRHNLAENDSDSGFFTVQDIKNISEIGLPVEDVSAVSTWIQSKFNVEPYKDINEVFCPLGDEEGMFILSSINRDWLGSDKKVEVFPLSAYVYSRVDRVETLLNYPYVIYQVVAE